MIFYKRSLQMRGGGEKYPTNSTKNIFGTTEPI